MMRRAGAARAVWRPLVAGTLLASGLVFALPATQATALSASSGNFGFVAFGNTVEKVITITNNTGSSDTILGVGAPPGSTEYDLVSSAGCLNVTLSPGASCQVTYSYTPVTVTIGTPPTVNVIISSSHGSFDNASIGLTGIGVPLSLATANPFGDVKMGDPASTQQLALTNVAVGVNYQLSGANATTPGAPFSATVGSCTNGTSLPPSGSCLVTATFNPTSASHIGPQSTNATYTFNGVQ